MYIWTPHCEVRQQHVTNRRRVTIVRFRSRSPQTNGRYIGVDRGELQAFSHVPAGFLSYKIGRPNTDPDWNSNLNSKETDWLSQSNDGIFAHYKMIQPHTCVCVCDLELNYIAPICHCRWLMLSSSVQSISQNFLFAFHNFCWSVLNPRTFFEGEIHQCTGSCACREIVSFKYVLYLCM